MAALVLLSLMALDLAAQELPASGAAAPAKRPRIGLALSGGGARGAAHIGVLRVMERLRIPVDAIAGTSMGSIIGALYASGMSPDEMEKALEEIDWIDALKDDPPRREFAFRQKEDDFLYGIKAELGFRRGKVVFPRGFVAGEKLGFILRTLLLGAEGVTRFDSLPIPYRAVGTDLETGAKVVLSRGDLAMAVRASMAIPGVFTPSEIDGRILVDGGMASNMPAEVVREMGVDVVIAVDISTPLVTREKLVTAFAILNQTSGFLTYLNVEEQIRALGKSDVLVRPNLEGIGTLQFEKVEEALKRGVAGAEAVKDQLSALSATEADFQEFLARQRRPPKPLPVIDELRVADVDGIDSRWITRRILTVPGRPLDLALLRDDFGRIYELGDFDLIDFHLRKEKDRTILEIAPHLKPIAPGRFRLGLNFTTDFNTQSYFDFRLGYTETRLNRLRADWRTRIVLGNTVSIETEFYQPLDYSGRFFIAPRVGFERKRVSYYDQDFASLVVRFDTPYAGFDTGISFGKYGELRLGYLRGRSSLGSIVSPVDLAGLEINHGMVTARAAFDQLDNVSFPQEGYNVTAEADFGRTGFGSLSNFDKLSFSGTKVFRLGGTAIAPSVMFATPLGGSLPFWEWTSLGGPLALSGLRPDQLLGPYAGLGRIVAYRPLGPGGTAGTFYLGGSLETGNAWQTTRDIKLGELRYSGSLFLGIDSPLGPVYLGAGLADGGNKSVYLLIGTDFR